MDDDSRDGTWTRFANRRRQTLRARYFLQEFSKEGDVRGLKHDARRLRGYSDADLQFRLRYHRNVRDLAQGGCDIVEASNLPGRESLVYKFFTRAFYGLLRLMSGIDLNNASDFKLLDRRVIAALDELGEKQTFFRAMSEWVGFKTETVGFNVAKRNAGKTKWSAKKLIGFALRSISAYTSAPLHFVTFFGVISLLGAAVLALFTALSDFKNYSTGLFCWAVAIMLAIGGILMLALGILGFYISRVYDEIKGRPRYIIAKTTDKG